MKKRIFSLLLAGCMLFGMLPLEVVAEEAQEVPEAQEVLNLEEAPEAEEASEAEETSETEEASEAEETSEAEEASEAEETSETEEASEAEEALEAEEASEPEAQLLEEELEEAGEQPELEGSIPPSSEWLPCPIPNGQGNDVIFQMEQDGPWYKGILAAALHYVYEDGTIMLLKDFYITGQTGIPSITKPMTLTSYDDPDTEGQESHKITCAINGHPTLLMVYSEARLENVMIDGGAEQGLAATGPLVLVENGSLTLGEGAFIQNNSNQNSSSGKNWLGGGVFLNGTMVMERGSAIRNCRAWAGGGVAVVNNDDSCLTLRGGSIENCESYQGGGVGVFKGSLKLEEGQIKSCRAVEPESKSLLDYIDAHTELESPGEGGGVFLSWSHSVMEMSGGEITDNHAAISGGGIGCDYGKLTLSGGKITGNRAEQYGGGVLASPLLEVTVSGNVQITGNESGTTGFEDFYLDGSEDWMESEENAAATNPFVITAPLEADFTLNGLSRWMQPVKEDPERIYRVVAIPGESDTGERYTITEEDQAHFFSDDPRYVIRLMEIEGVKKLVLTFPVVTYQDGPEGAALEEESYLCTGGEDTPEFAGTLEREGYHFEGWLPEVAEKVSGDTTYIAQWKPVTYPITYQLDGGENGAENPDSYTIASETITLKAPAKEGYTFLGWTWEGENTPQERVTILKGSTGERKFTAHWEKIEEPPTPDWDDDDDDDPRPMPSASPTPTPSESALPTPSGTPEPIATEIPAPSPAPSAEPETAVKPELPEEPAPEEDMEETEIPKAEIPFIPDPEPSPEPAPEPIPDPVPQMGDPALTGLWTLGVLTSLAGFVLVLRPRRRRRQ